MTTMQNNKQYKTNPLPRVQASVRARLTFNAARSAYAFSVFSVFSLSACAVCLSGCSGFPTDGLAGAPLSNHPILPTESAVVMQAEPDEAMNKLAKMVGATASSTIDTPAEDAVTPPSQNYLQTPGFSFQTDLPAEPNFSADLSDDITVAEIAPIVAQVDAGVTSELSDEPISPPNNTIILVAATQPIEATPPIEAIQPSAKTRPIGAGVTPEPLSLPPQPDFAPRPLKPITPLRTIPEPESAPTPKAAPAPAPAPTKEIKFSPEPPPISAVDLQELTRPAAETLSMGSAESIDLSELEFESTLASKLNPPTAEPTKAAPTKKSLTATEHLSETIRLIEATVSETSVSGERHGAEPGLQLLEILRQKMNRGSSPDWHLSGEEHQYWQEQLEAVSVMFAANQTASDGADQPRHQTATRAIEHLELAASHLRSIAGLKLHGGQLCSQILGFGKFEELESKQFQTGDRALIYIELENQSSQNTSNAQQTTASNHETWQTRLRANYAIVDANGKIAHQETYPVIEDTARRHRRDFYLHLPLTITELPPGDYQLTVSVEDLGNDNTATLPAIDFSVTQASNQASN